MTAKTPCGQVLGHGERCVEGHLCESCGEIRRLRQVKVDVGRANLTMLRDEFRANEADMLTRARLIDDPYDKHDLHVRGGIWANAANSVETLINKLT